MGHVSRSPPTIPDGRISRVRFWPRLCTPFSRCGPSRQTRRSSAGAHTRRPTTVYPHPGPKLDGSCRYPWYHYQTPQPHRDAHVRRVPRAPLPVRNHRVFSRNTSEDITLPSSLLRAHAPGHLPLSASGLCPGSENLRRLSPVPAARWSFPTLSLPSLRRRLDPYPAASLGCVCPLLLQDPRPHVTGNTFGTRILPLSSNFPGRRFRGCSRSFTFRLPRSLGPQVAPTATSLSMPGGRAVYTTHRPDGYPCRDVVSLHV